MSGGVDSSVSALLLKKAGWEVEGVMLRTWHENEADGTEEARAAETAERIGIPFRVLDRRDLFYHEVVEDFMEEYLAGKTPNPCVRCNETVKFHELNAFAETIGADAIATGHYARVETLSNGKVRLCRAADLSKDQSYVLAHLPLDILRKLVLPLAELTKPRIRELAAESGLPCAERKDSQDICFIADNDYRRFLCEHCGERISPGEIRDVDGNVIGKHEGLPFYTIGQRRGLYIYRPEPTFVLGKDIQRNVLIVGDREAAGKTRITLERFFSLNAPEAKTYPAEAQFRYRAKPRKACVTVNGELAAVECEEPLYDVAPGQLAVLYSGEDVIASGFIIRTEASV